MEFSPLRQITARDQPYDLILFDLDGTLTDPKSGITKSVQFALTRFDVMIDDPDELVEFIGPPLAESFGRYFGLDDSQARQAIAAYRERFADVGLYENAVYPGIPELLSRLAAAGRTLAIASSKPTVYVERILDHFNLNQYFTVVVGSNLDLTRVTKDEVIGHARSLLPHAEASRSLMIGDREHDILGARAHGISTIAAGYGYGSREELMAAGPLAIADSVDALGLLLGVRD